MCGIVGMAGNLNSSTNKMFNNMLIFDQIRGSHSTGVAVVPSISSEVSVEKDIGSPANLWEYESSKLFDSKGYLKNIPKVVIGHNRSATVGSITVENSHPFQFEHITGVHNGSLTYYRDLEGHNTHEVDSQAIFDTISKKGIDHCWESFYGAACLVWWDSKEGSLNIIRNDQRPLCIAYSEKEDAVFWASEEWMIIVAAGRNNVNLKKNENGKTVIAIPTAGTLYKYTPTNLTCPLTEVRELKKKTYTPPKETTGGKIGQTTGYQGAKQSFTEGSSGFGKAWNDQPWGLTHSWASGWERAEKDIIGTKFNLKGLIRTSEHGKKGFYVYGETEDGCRVEVYPFDQSEYPDWSMRMVQLPQRDLWFEITKRPRVRNHSLPLVKNMYRISSAHVQLHSSSPKSNVIPFVPQQNLPLSEPLFKSRTGHVTEERWHEIMSAHDINHSCTACNNPITIEQHKELVWVNDKCVLCKDCGEDKSVLEFVQSYHQ